MSRTKAPAPLTAEQLAEVEMDFIDERAAIGDAYHDARIKGDNARARRLWEYLSARKAQQHAYLAEQEWLLWHTS